MKVLIFKKECDLAPIGGPNGYLYNLKKGLDNFKNNNVYFLDGEIKKRKYAKIKDNLKKYGFIKKYIENKSKKNSILYYKKMFDDILNNKLYSECNEDLSKYDAIHFHSTLDLYRMRKKLKYYHGKILLTSHSPMPTYQELLNNLAEAGYKFGDEYNNIDVIDKYAFNRANYIVFPCKEAEEPYYNRWDEYKKIHDNNKGKYRYILSGLDQVKINISRDEIRSKYNIPKDAFLVSYVGRHNEVKGYDILKEIAKDILLKYDNIYFICAGKEGPLFHLENSHWIEVGWTKDPYSVVAASDLFILPNRETYFDLVFLEVLSTATPMLVSYTGGNKYFEKYSDVGIFYYKNVKEAVNQIENIMKIKNLKQLGINNKKLFDNEFDSKVFAKNYLELINKLK